MAQRANGKTEPATSPGGPVWPSRLLGELLILLGLVALAASFIALTSGRR